MQEGFNLNAFLPLKRFVRFSLSLTRRQWDSDVSGMEVPPQVFREAPEWDCAGASSAVKGA